jgi:hypothetical protein
MHGQIHDTFQEARLTMEVLEDDKKWFGCFLKTSFFQTSSQL